MPECGPAPAGTSSDKSTRRDPASVSVAPGRCSQDETAALFLYSEGRLLPLATAPHSEAGADLQWTLQFPDSPDDLGFKGPLPADELKSHSPRMSSLPMNHRQPLPERTRTSPATCTLALAHMVAAAPEVRKIARLSTHHNAVLCCAHLAVPSGFSTEP